MIQKIIRRNFCLLTRNLSSKKISEIYSNKITDEVISIKGWIRSIRKMKLVVFLDVFDGSSFRVLQTVVPKSILSKDLTYGASIEITGKLTTAPSGQIELQTETLKVLGECHVDEGYPFLPRTKYKAEELREYLHFRPRTLHLASALRIRSHITNCIHAFFQRENFINIHTPVLTSNDCEGAGEVFVVTPNSKDLINEMKKEGKTDEEAFFDDRVYLTVSGQLHLEVTARALCNVYQFGPVFRAENCKSRLHLSEFYMVEAEVAFTNNIEDILKLMEKLIKNTTRNILETYEEEINDYRKSLSLPQLNFNNIVEKPYMIMTFDDAYSILRKYSNDFETSVEGCKHLSKEQELFLVKHNDNVPVFIIDWPIDGKPFYVKTSSSRMKAAAVDLLFPEVGELCGGSLREDNYDVLKQKLVEHNLLDKLNWYLDLRKFGNVSTGGFGMGFERYLKVILGTVNIKDTIPFPRWPHKCQL